MKDVNIHPLLLRMKDGDKTAFAELYEETRDDVYRMIAMLVPNTNDHVEVCSDVYIQVWKSFQSYEDSRPFRYWLHGIAIRQASNYKRNLWRRFRLIEKQKQSPQPFAASSADSLLHKEIRDELLEEIWKLSPKLRHVIVLRYYHDYSFEQMSALLDIPIGTVKSRHHTALNKLRNTRLSIHNQEEVIPSGTRTKY